MNAPQLIVADNEHTRSYGIAGMQALIDGQTGSTYSVLVLDMDGLPAGPYQLTGDELIVRPLTTAPKSGMIDTERGGSRSKP